MEQWSFFNLVIPLTRLLVSTRKAARLEQKLIRISALLSPQKRIGKIISFQTVVTRSLTSAAGLQSLVENTPWLNTLQLLSFATMLIRKILATNLKRHRQAAGLSQEELAHRADIDRTYISSLERYQYAASIDVIENLARELDVEPFELLRPPNPAPTD